MRLLSFSALTLSFPALAFMLALSFPLQADVYTWREGPSFKYSNLPPNWYRIDAPARGPRVVVTRGKRVIDDTALPIEDRRRLRPPLRVQAPAPAGK